MTFYSKMAKTADKLINKFGKFREMELIREKPTGDDYDPDPPVRIRQKVLGVVRLKTVMEDGSRLDNFQGGTLIDNNRRSVSLSKFDPDGRELIITPEMGDKLEFDGHEWTVEAAAGVNPGGETILYKLDVTK